MPETGRTGKRMYASPCRGPTTSTFRTEHRDSPLIIASSANGSASDPATIIRQNTGRRREVGKSFNGYPLTTGRGDRILYLEATQ
jgi:hypothetical protein